MNVRLDGKVALVTGGSRGIGLEIARQFAGAGARVMICSRKPSHLEAAAASIDGDVAWMAANAADDAAAQRVVDETVNRFGGLDILVNNAATNPHFGPLIGITKEQMNKTTDVNQRAIVSWTQLAWAAAMERHGGTVINIASIGGQGVEENIGYYNATKAAVIHLTNQFAVELGPSVRVLGIAPGIVKTDMAQALWSGREEDLAAGLPIGRLGETSDVAAVAVFLASDVSAWMTGTTVTVDGGGHLRP